MHPMMLKKHNSESGKEINRRYYERHRDEINARNREKRKLVSGEKTWKGDMRMATKFEFYLSEDDTERLFAVKEKNGKGELTGNEYAKELLKSILIKMHPTRVEYDESGRRIN